MESLNLDKAYEVAADFAEYNGGEPGDAWLSHGILDAALPHILDALAEQATAESDAQPHWVAPRITAGWLRAKAVEVRGA
ncbi:hypothetical protein AB0284_21510 [Pseudarthrobacter phenanthrenivorans]|uniref:hypothetical protein n=1 Tax=Pseudarthrobacter phenanthrenivorans TaxID=361575 RepID=UPI00344F0336